MKRNASFVPAAPLTLSSCGIKMYNHQMSIDIEDGTTMTKLNECNEGFPLMRRFGE